MPIHELKKIIVQLLAALCFLHTNRIAHADLKPENLLLAKESLQCKIVDFGNAIDMSKNEQQAYYKDFNVQTLYYRAPEVVFGLPFDTSIDMWSLGCIIYEIYTGDVLFKSRNCTELVQQMFGVLGNVPSELYSRGKFYKDYECFKVEKPKQSKTNLHDRTFVTLCQKMRVHDANFVQFIQGLLEYDPVKRMTPQQALLHPFIAKMFPFAIAFPNTNIVQPTVSAVSSPVVTNKRPFDMVDKRQDQTPPRKLQIIESRTHTASAIRSTFYQK
jgi:serine/threonine protein kinase